MVRTARLNLNCWSVGAGPDVVLVHGLASNLAFWYPLVARRLARRFRVTAYDLRGHGYSDMPATGYTSADMAEDLRSLLDRLRIDSAHVVGHSFGGAVALHFASLFPERARSVTLADARIHSLQPLPGRGDRRSWQTWRTSLEAHGVDVPGDLPQVAYGLVEDIARERDRGRDARLLPFVAPYSVKGGSGRGGRRWRTLLATTSALPEFADEAGLTRDAIARVDTPVLAVYGEYSHCLPTLAGVEALLPRCRTVTLRKVGHFHPIVRAAPFTGHVRSFVTQTEPGRTRRGAS
jgi:pimeloyl-ACP methyl ester carboxylesterase